MVFIELRLQSWWVHGEFREIRWKELSSVASTIWTSCESSQSYGFLYFAELSDQYIIDMLWTPLWEIMCILHGFNKISGCFRGFDQQSTMQLWLEFFTVVLHNFGSIFMIIFRNTWVRLFVNINLRCGKRRLMIILLRIIFFISNFLWICLPPPQQHIDVVLEGLPCDYGPVIESKFGDI